MRTLLFGSNGDDVVILQTLLNLTGAKLTTDGRFGLGTREAVRLFQLRNGLLVDGIVGPTTWKYLKMYDTGADYTLMSTGLHVVKVKPLDLKIVMEANTGSGIKLKNAVNGSFVWWTDTKKTKPFPTSIVVYDGKILHNAQPNGYTWQVKPHFQTGAPTPVFIVYKNGTVTVKDVNHFTPDEASQIHIAVTGIDLLPKVRTTGFVPYVNFSTVDYRTNRIAIGYDVQSKKVILAFRKSTTALQMSSYMKSIGCELAVSLDSGGSANYIVGGNKINATTRRMITWITW